jgi:hypothetical protein
MEAAGVPRLDVERPFSSNKEAGPPLNAGHWSAWAIAAGQERDVVSRLCRCGGRGTKRATYPSWDSTPNCALGTLAY